MNQLRGKNVVITGSGRGIGAACARAIARRGAAVVVNDVDRDVTEQTTAAIVAAVGRAKSARWILTHMLDLVPGGRLSDPLFLNR